MHEVALSKKLADEQIFKFVILCIVQCVVMEENKTDLRKQIYKKTTVLLQENKQQ